MSAKREDLNLDQMFQRLRSKLTSDEMFNLFAVLEADIKNELFMKITEEAVKARPEEFTVPVVLKKEGAA